MRFLSILIVGCALAIVAVVWIRRPAPPEGAVEGGLLVPSFEIKVTGTGNTLASLAQRVNNPGMLRYDPATRTATANASLIVEGELTLGQENTPDSGEILEFDTQVCGDHRLEVRKSGRLKVFHSTLRTVSQRINFGACSKGYALFVDGDILLDNSRVTYLSGSASQCLRGGARATIRKTVFANCDGNALSCVNADGEGIHIEDSDFLSSGNWGVVVIGSGGAPVELRRCVLQGEVGVLFVSGEDARVRLVDCTFDRSRLAFNRDTGQVEVAWTRQLRIMDAGGAPMAGVVIRAEPQGSGSLKPVEAVTDSTGVARLQLVQSVARPGDDPKSVAVARAYKLSVRRPGGEELASRSDLTIQGAEAGVQEWKIGGVALERREPALAVR